MEITLSPTLYNAYQCMRDFYSFNDALPTARTLARLLHVPVFEAKIYIETLRSKGVIAVNSQKGYMFQRGRKVLKGKFIDYTENQ